MGQLDRHIQARSDADLRDRVIAAAEIAGIPGAQQWAESRMGKIVAADIGDGHTLAAGYENAVANYDPPPRPGADPTRVQDAQIIAAVAKIDQAEKQALTAAAAGEGAEDATA